MRLSRRWAFAGLLVPVAAFLAWRSLGTVDPPDIRTGLRDGSTASQPVTAPAELIPPAASPRAVAESTQRADLRAPPPVVTAGFAALAASAARVRVFVSVVEARTREPVSGATVRAVGSLEFHSASAHEPEEVVLEGTTDAAGRVAFPWAHPGLLSFTALQAGRHGSGALDAAEPGDYQLEIGLQPSTVVRGVVLDDATGEPVSGARVSCYVRDALGMDAVRTDAVGRFEIGPWPFDVTSGLSVRADGYGYELVKLSVSADEAWSVPARFGVPETRGNGTPSVDIRLVPEKVVTGRAVDTSGSGYRGARVSAQGMFLVMANVGRRDDASAIAASDGSFRIAGLRSDIQHAVTVEAEGAGSSTVIARGRDVRVDLGDIRLGVATSVAGSVHDAAGLPVSAARVTLLRPAEVGVEAVLDPEAGVNSERDAWGGGLIVFERECYTDAVGAFVLEDLPPGNARLLVEVAGRRQLERALVVTSGAQALGVLALPRATSAVTGVVEGLTGSGHQIEIAAPGGAVLARAALDATGAFRVSGLSADEPFIARLVGPLGGDETRRFPFVNDGQPLRWSW